MGNNHELVADLESYQIVTWRIHFLCHRVLMRAAKGYDDGEIVQLLIDAGADPNLRNNDGKTAFDLTRNLNHSGAESRGELLKSAMQLDSGK